MRYVIVCALLLAGCKEGTPSLEVRTVSLRNSDVFQYPTVAGDEEGARVSAQARHYTVSEIRRNAETNWVATYVYQPLSGFVGSDEAEIEILTGSDGASSPRTTTKIVFHFLISQ